MFPRLLAIVLLLTATGAGAQNHLYYRLGGAKPFSAPPTYRSDIRINASFDTRSRFHCGLFDFDASVGNLLSNARRRLRTQFALAIRSLLAALPALLLQRINPGLYDFFQNLMIRAEGDVRFAMASCRDMEQAIAKGENPFAWLSREAITWDWQVQGLGQSGDVVAARESVDEKAGQNGVPWCDGAMRGGVGQAHIRPVSDTTVAGYNALSGIGDCASLATRAERDSRLGRTFPSAEAAANWTAEVIGDYELTTTDSGVRASLAGTGLAPKVEAMDRQVVAVLSASMHGPQPLPANTRALLDAPDLLLGSQLVNAMREWPPEDRDPVVARLAAEIAMARVIDQALLARQILMTGRDLPELQNSQAIQAYVDKGLARLTAHIEGLMFEARVRRELVSLTALTITERAGAVETATSVDAPSAPVNDKPLRRDGAVSRDPEDS